MFDLAKHYRTTGKFILGASIANTGKSKLVDVNYYSSYNDKEWQSFFSSWWNSVYQPGCEVPVIFCALKCFEALSRIGRALCKHKYTVHIRKSQIWFSASLSGISVSGRKYIRTTIYFMNFVKVQFTLFWSKVSYLSPLVMFSLCSKIINSIEIWQTWPNKNHVTEMIRYKLYLSF